MSFWLTLTSWLIHTACSPSSVFLLVVMKIGLKKKKKEKHFKSCNIPVPQSPFLSLFLSVLFHFVVFICSFFFLCLNCCTLRRKKHVTNLIPSFALFSSLRKTNWERARGKKKKKERKKQQSRTKRRKILFKIKFFQYLTSLYPLKTNRRDSP